MKYPGDDGYDFPCGLDRDYKKRTVVKSEQVMGCDIDQTLLLWDNPPVDCPWVWFNDPYDKQQKAVCVHGPNLKVFKDRLERGATFLVWSASGGDWADAALEALGIDHKNIFVFGKPIGYLDDKPCEQWMGERIWLNPESKYGV